MFYIKGNIIIEKDARSKFCKKNNLKFSAGENKLFGLHQEKTFFFDTGMYEKK